MDGIKIGKVGRDGKVHCDKCGGTFVDQNAWNNHFVTGQCRRYEGRRGVMTIEAIMKLQETLLTDTAIGIYFGVTRQAVYQQRKKHGLASISDKHKNRDLQIYWKYRGGKSGTRIAIEMDMSISQIYRVIRKMNKKHPLPQGTEPDPLADVGSTLVNPPPNGKTE